MAVIGGCVKNIGLRFRCHAQILIGGGGTDDLVICRDPSSTVYQAIVPTITAKKVVIREKTATHQSRS
jgi:hypothetical protein